ncbi:hypothetical protein Q8A73_009597 [Channa argus]|nr:hypothetical protein Q8A73_009597 [Channa argus]
MLPDDRSEIPTPEVAGHYAHLKQVADKIPAIDENAAILILLGRDILRVHKVREHCNGPHNAPYAQRLDLGWVIIGEVCLGGAHVPANVNVYKTCVLYNGRTSLFEPCNNGLHVKEEVNTPASYTRTLNITDIIKSDETDSLGEELFRRTPHDDIPTISVDEKVFLDILDKEMFVNEANSWTAPLPFRSPRHRLPNNRDQAVKRHAEPAPPLNKEKECWYLPIFGVYHPRKPDASTLAVSAVAYLRAFDEEGQVHVGFCMGKSKLAPRQPHTVPCLELCAAVLAVEKPQPQPIPLIIVDPQFTVTHQPMSPHLPSLFPPQPQPLLLLSPVGLTPPPQLLFRYGTTPPPQSNFLGEGSPSSCSCPDAEDGSRLSSPSSCSGVEDGSRSSGSSSCSGNKDGSRSSTSCLSTSCLSASCSCLLFCGRSVSSSSCSCLREGRRRLRFWSCRCLSCLHSSGPVLAQGSAFASPAPVPVRPVSGLADFSGRGATTGLIPAHVSGLAEVQPASGPDPAPGSANVPFGSSTWSSQPSGWLFSLSPLTPASTLVTGGFQPPSLASCPTPSATSYGPHAPGRDSCHIACACSR